ncbi:FadR/GntR family transcriptional regulator [Actinoplanes teichomyceticus]|uniref:FCD domain-containing protein n=1 Tax=Actinoplanes teichomyceticus TaxID=1867 RepID=A0A561VCR4_ACTTI|nr:FCD domain-containing protein [Actinoplanes teichomyceticus]TWG09387.1 FCD domain-containing protein [Actinoplanes teichomyceticus]GIF17030.1 hypothetical protein Ate01nite_70620 [Actinoplanes teichomyceticus]
MSDELIRLRAELDALRLRAFEPSLRKIARNSGGRISHPTVKIVLSCAKLPGWELVKAVVEALGGDTDHFGALWTAAFQAERLASGSPAGLPAGRPGDAGEPAGWDVFDLAAVRRQLTSSPRFLMRSLTELRSAIEPVASFLAAERFSEAESAELVRLARRLQELGRDETFSAETAAGAAHREAYRSVDVRFHATLLRGCRNEFFRDLTGHVAVALDYRILRDRVGTGGNKPFPDAPTALSLWLHRGLAAAVRQGRCSAAEGFSRALLAEIRQGPLPESVALALEAALAHLDTDGPGWTGFVPEIRRLLDSQTWPGR